MRGYRPDDPMARLCFDAGPLGTYMTSNTFFEGRACLDIS